MPLIVEPSKSATARTVSVSEFRANCSPLLDTVRDTGEEIIVTKHGHPVARVAPLSSHPAGTLVGMASDLIRLPPDFDIDEVRLIDPGWYGQWSSKWDGRLAAGPAHPRPPDAARDPA